MPGPFAFPSRDICSWITQTTACKPLKSIYIHSTSALPLQTLTHIPDLFILFFKSSINPHPQMKQEQKKTNKITSNQKGFAQKKHSSERQPKE